jgi:serine O-acetyltransferase
LALAKVAAVPYIDKDISGVNFMHQSTDPVARQEAFDPIWARLRTEAEGIVMNEPSMALLALAAVLNETSFEAAVIRRVATRLGCKYLNSDLIAQAFMTALNADPQIGEAFRADILAVIDRDPASDRLIEPLLFFKGFHAIQTHRLAHWLWQNERRDLALYLQSRSSETFQTDIHPAARIGAGIFLDHATGLVVGATATIGDDVSMLQNVTLGGTGNESGNRHPQIGRGVLIGAGAKILGNIEIGPNARIAAGSVVLNPVPARSTVAGVPARIVSTSNTSEPAKSMDQMLSEISYASFDYTI